MKNLFTALLIVINIYCFGQVTLNEIQSSNNSTISDDFGEFDDWIEIHNPTTDTIEIGGLILKDRIDTWTIPTGIPTTLIPPDGYFLLWADDQEFQGDSHTNFKLASSGEFLGLYESDGLTVIDSITLPALSSNDSYIKCSTEWSRTISPTPLADNNCTATPIKDLNYSDIFSVKINNKQIEVTVLDNLESEKSLSIYSIDGKEWMKQTWDTKKTKLNLNMLNSNIYIVKIVTSDFIYSKKIVL